MKGGPLIMNLIEDDILERFKMVIESNLGLSVRTEDNESFRKTLRARMKIHGIVTPEEYLCFLESGSMAGKKEWKALILLTTTGESYFFRDKGHFHLLQNSILPELITNKERLRSLRIWSAGCSTGEEPYSIAILLDMLLPDLNGWRIDILGTDINEEFLQKAERGIYSEWSFRLLDKEIQRKYFTRHPEGWKIQEHVKKMVKFQYGNLMEAGFYSHYPEICNMDIIICRNVFIYFKAESVSSVFKNFIQILNQEGYLITGHGELYGLNLTGLRQIMSPDAVIYKKTLEPKVPDPPIARSPEPIKENKSAKDKVKQIVTKELAASKKVETKPHTTMPDVQELISTGRYAEAVEKTAKLELANRDKSIIMLSIAQAYANSGKYEHAESCCRKSITLHAESADPYFLLAQIAEAQGNDEEAKLLLNKTIYLNPACIPAYCELGGLFERHNDHARAKKYRITAIELLITLPAQMIVKPYDIAAGELLAYIRDLIKP